MNRAIPHRERGTVWLAVLLLLLAALAAAPVPMAQAADAGGTVIGWGDNFDGQIDVPADLADATAIAAGYRHSLALRAEGTVAAWGWNEIGQTDVPTGLEDATAIAAGGGHSLALRADGTVAAWGYNRYGQTDVPAGLDDATAISAGSQHSLALRADGTVIGWGRNDFGETDGPAGLDDAIAIAAGGMHSLALRADGTVAAWGYNGHGQSDVPGDLDDATAIAAGGTHSLALVPAPSGPEFVGMDPVRVADTRYGTGVPAGKIAPGQTLSVPVAGKYGVPPDVKAVSLNATVTQPGGSGYVTVYPCGTARPLASNLNFVAGQTVPNAVVVKPGAGGVVCLYASTSTHLVVDLNGYFPTTADYAGIVPMRAADTRYGTGVPQAKVPAGQTLAVPVAGLYGIAADATSVAANVTVTQPAWRGYVTVWPCGEPRPFASNLNYVAGQTVPNAVIAGIGENGSICLYTTAATHLVVDVGGSFTEAAAYEPLVPERVFDTRTDWDRTKLPAGYEIPIQFAEPGELVAVVLNVTVTQPETSGYITVYPCSDELPLASNLNFVKGQTVPNMVIAPVNAQGEVCFYTSQTTHILADINGVFFATADQMAAQASE